MLNPDARSTSGARATAQARYDEGEAFFKQGKFDKALAALRAAVEKDPEMSEAWYMMGLAEMEKNGGQPCEAAHDPFERCVELDPNCAGAHSALGDVLLDVRKDDVRAEEHFRAATRLDPNLAPAHHGLSDVLYIRGDLDGAIRAMRDCVEAGGDSDDRAHLDALLAKKRTAHRAAKPNPEAKARFPLPVARAPPRALQSC